MTNYLIKLAIFVLSNCLTYGALAQPISVVIGETRIALPELPPLIEMSGNKRVFEWANSAVEPTTRLLSVFVDDNRKGIADLAFRRYVIAKTPIRLAKQQMSSQQFLDLRRTLKNSTANLGSMVNKFNAKTPSFEADLSRSLESRIERLGIGSSMLLDVLRDDARGFGYAYIASYQADIDGTKRNWKVAICASALHLQGKLLLINFYTAYNGPEDIEWLRSACRKFTDGVLIAN